MATLPTVSFDLEGDGSIVREDDIGTQPTRVLPTVRVYKPHKPVIAGSTYRIGEKLLRPRDLDCYQELENPGRPKFLSKLLDGLKESLDDGENIYKEFECQFKGKICRK